MIKLSKRKNIYISINDSAFSNIYSNVTTKGLIIMVMCWQSVTTIFCISNSIKIRNEMSKIWRKVSVIEVLQTSDNVSKY